MEKLLWKQLSPGIKSHGIKPARYYAAWWGRYLEHARVFIFHNNGSPKVFLGSADWMERNLRSRVEVVFPVYDEECKKQIFRFVQIQLTPYQKSNLIDSDLQPIPYDPSKERGYDAQEAFYQFISTK